MSHVTMLRAARNTPGSRSVETDAAPLRFCDYAKRHPATAYKGLGCDKKFLYNALFNRIIFCRSGFYGYICGRELLTTYKPKETNNERFILTYPHAR